MWETCQFLTVFLGQGKRNNPLIIPAFSKFLDLEPPNLLSTAHKILSLGHFPYLEITAGNRLEEIVKLTLYGTFEDDDNN